MNTPGNTPENSRGNPLATLQRRLKILITCARDYRHAHRHFRKTDKMCFFIGSGRTGSSLLGALLNAHPEIVIAHEYNLIWRILGYKMPSLFLSTHLIEMMFYTKQQNRKPGGLHHCGYRYYMEGMHQHDVSNPRVFGDKKATLFSLAVREYGPKKVETLLRGGWPIRLIHIIRNPYDVIATMHRWYSNNSHAQLFRHCSANWRLRNAFPEIPVGEADPMREMVERGEREQRENKMLMLLAAHFFTVMEGVLLMKKHGASPILDVHYKHLTQNPAEKIKRIVQWLGLECDEDYLSACAQMVGPMSRTREQVAHLFTEDVRALIDEQIQRFDFLRGYGWDTDEPPPTSWSE